MHDYVHLRSLLEPLAEREREEADRVVRLEYPREMELVAERVRSSKGEKAPLDGWLVEALLDDPGFCEPVEVRFPPPVLDRTTLALLSYYGVPLGTDVSMTAELAGKCCYFACTISWEEEQRKPSDRPYIVLPHGLPSELFKALRLDTCGEPFDAYVAVAQAATELHERFERGDVLSGLDNILQTTQGMLRFAITLSGQIPEEPRLAVWRTLVRELTETLRIVWNHAGPGSSPPDGTNTDPILGLEATRPE